MVAEPVPTRSTPPADDLARTAEPTPIRRPAAPSKTRSTSLSRARRVELLRQGNTNALRHGAFARVQAGADVTIEIGLTIASYPGLDPIADRRLVEQLAETRVTRQRAMLAMDVEGMTPTLTAFMSKMAALEERLERSAYERERQRSRDRSKAGADPLERYRSGGST